MKTTKRGVPTKKTAQLSFFKKYNTYNRTFMLDLIKAYKERGRFPMFPTFIANYYDDENDKAIAAISTMCLDWGKDVFGQVKALRDLMGEHPYEWFTRRSFVVLSIGKNQETQLGGSFGIKYWRLARFFSELYDTCEGKPLRKAFPSGVSSGHKTKMVSFAESLEESVGLLLCAYKAEVIELVLRGSDGFSIGLWRAEPRTIRCPRNAALKRFMKTWFPDYNNRSWGWHEAIGAFELERDSDFFYYYLAWEELKKANKDGCVRYSTRFVSRYNGGYLMGPVFWTGKRGLIPKIKFIDD